jgi:hypothetical protein
MSADDSAHLETATQQLDAFVYESGCSEGVDFCTLEVGAIVNVFTKYSRYRLVALNPQHKSALVTGGRLFPQATEVRIEGATAGGSAIRPGWVGVGLRLEMSNGSNRVTTSVVQSVTVDQPPASKIC